MGKIFKALALIGGLGVVQNAAASNLLVNGDFESPVQVGPFFATFNIPNAQVPVSNTYITGWTVFQGNVDLTTTANYGPGINTLDLGSKQDIDLIGDTNGTGGVLGGMSQSFSTTAGQTYRLTFDYSHNPGASSNNFAAQVKLVDANAPGNSILTTSVSQAAGLAPWLLFTQDFTAISDSTLLSFTSTQGGFNGGIYLDDVSVEALSATATPIPGALPLFASGASVLGFFGWRKKRKSAALAA
jgi:hypothetical protein